MIFRQITHDDLGCASYLIGDEDAGVVAVVDPKLDISEYLRLSRFLGVRIEHILETHTHADHVSGHSRLAEATGATIHIHRDAGAQYPHQPFEDGFELELGAVRVRAIHTPGHRPEHTSFALIDTRRGPEPWALLSGDSLFVGDVARPDLAVDKHDGATGIYHSLQKLLATLPPETELWPGHLGGSMCGGAGMDLKVCSTLAYERAHNDMLHSEDEQAFVAAAIGTLGPQPPNFQAIVELNRGDHRTDVGQVPPIETLQLQRMQADGALVVDVRTDLEFDEAHIPGAVCVPAVQFGFGTRLAWIADSDRQVIFVGDDGEDARRAAALAGSVGLRNLAGYLAGGMSEWRTTGSAVSRIERLPLDDLRSRAESDPAMQIIDVRERSEHASGHIPGSLLLPWHDIDQLPDGLDPRRPVAVICASGQRAAVAGSLLESFGADRVIHVVDGGVPKWEELGNPLQRDANVDA